MNLFDALLLTNVVLALLALARLRPASFIWLGQQSVTIRAFSNIHDYGAPSSQPWLPTSLFNADALTIAFSLLALSTLCCGLGLLLPARVAQPAEVGVVRLPNWLMAIVWVFFVVVALSRKTIFVSASTSEASQNFDFNLGGANALMCGLLLYDLEARRAAGQLSSRNAFLICCLVLTFSFLIQGSTGYVTGCMVLAAFLYLPRNPRGRFPTYMSTALAILVLIAATALVRQVRGTLASEGSQAVSGAVANMQDMESNRAMTGRGVEALMNGDQSAAHIVECINLWESNVSREWRSIYNPIIYTIEPSFLLGPLGLTRPREAAYELLDYYLHLGGIEVLGELYWNGGFLCVVIMVSLLTLLHWRCDTKMPSSSYWLMIACNYTPGILMGAHYGFAQVFRGLFNGLIGCAILKVVGYAATQARPRGRQVAPEALAQ